MLIKLSKNDFINCEINYKHEKDVLFRNLLQLFRICIQVTESGMTDSELSTKRFMQLNFNTFGIINKREMQRCKYRDDEGNIVNDFITCWNFNIKKCYKIVYNNIEMVQNLSKMIRWGALLYTDITNTKLIEKIIGDDLLNMEQRVKLIDRLNNVKNDNKIIQEWMVIENNRMREENILKTARDEGEENNRLKVIKNMLKKNTDYKYISEVTGKSIHEVKEITKNLLIPNI